MASILLASAGSGIGTAVGGPVGGFVGRYIGTAIGGSIDNKIFGARKLPEASGPRLADLSVQTSTEGKAIPTVFGNMRLAGNVIWTKGIKETVNSKTVTGGGGGKGGGTKVSQKQTTYSYSISLAIAVCVGVIDDVVRVWADSAVIDPTQGVYRLYKGHEEQNPDPLIESFEGVDSTPAYRGLAYVVIEDFPLAAYGNRIPNFTFEVKRRLLDASSGVPLEEKIKSVVMIPGSGEFVYDTVVEAKTGGDLVGSQFVQNGTEVLINQNNRSSKADALVALDQLDAELPNVEWVSVVVGWFGDSLDAGSCVIKPGVEYGSGSQTSPHTWSAGGYNRSSARLITQIDGAPIYGGTPDDGSLVRYVTELRARGYKIMFYPIVFMDVPGKPWRGRITGSAANVATFFTKTAGYNAFVNYYAALMAGKVDGFAIGSELIGLTSVNAGSGVFPAVSALVALAASVKSVVGSGCKVTYAADWSEYHHTTGGWYNLDPLWASSNIDVIGIDAYFPLSDAPQTGYDKQALVDGWSSGEDYDWYYNDVARTTKVALSPAYAIKNIDWWWNNYHVNPGGATTGWVPGFKKIWFTEFGFPSVDGCANQPNVFYDPSSSESAFPRFSKGRVDYVAQRTALEATIDKWTGSAMVERMFLWCWDARPYPFFPDLRSVWSDGNLWLYGHWLNGKLGLTSLASVIKEICAEAGFDVAKIGIDKINDLIDGFLLNSVSPARAALEQLQKGFFFDAVESDGSIQFVPRGQDILAAIDMDDLVPINAGKDQSDLLKLTRAQELELPQKVNVSYIDRALDYQIGNQHSTRMTTLSDNKDSQNLPIVFNDWQAKRIADISLYNAWISRSSFEFSLPLQYLEIEPTDVVSIDGNIIRVTDSTIGLNGEVRCKGVADDAGVYDFYTAPTNNGALTQIVGPVSATRLEILDIPSLNDADIPQIRFAACGVGDNWQGAVIYRSDDGGVSYYQFSEVVKAGVIGNVLVALSVESGDLYDSSAYIDVNLISGELESVSDLALLNGANVALVGNEIIQFQNAELIGENKYRLSNFLRGRQGTEFNVGTHLAGDRFILLNDSLVVEQMPTQLIGVSRKYKAVSLGANLTSGVAVDFTFHANSLVPYSPVAIKGVRDGTGNLALSWIRRTRIGGELRDGVDVPLSEDSEKYEVDILNGLTVVRTIAVTTPIAGYSATDQVTDFGTVQSSISLKVYQISALVGRGTAGVATI